MADEGHVHEVDTTAPDRTLNTLSSTAEYEERKCRVQVSHHQTAHPELGNKQLHQNQPKPKHLPGISAHCSATALQNIQIHQAF